SNCAMANESTVELHAPAELRIVQPAVVPGEVAVDPRRRDAGTERIALERRPAAFRNYRLARHGLRQARIDQGEIGPATLANEAAFAHTEQPRWRVHRALDDRLERDLAVEPALERTLQDKLHERQAGRRFLVALPLLVERVRGVVG